MNNGEKLFLGIKRRNYLEHVFNSIPTLENVPHNCNKIAVLIPTFSDKEVLRTQVFKRAVSSILSQSWLQEPNNKVKFYIVDNGLNTNERYDVENFLRYLDIPHTLITCHAFSSITQNAAYPRNQGIKYIIQDKSFKPDAVLFMDDDAAFTNGSLINLAEAYMQNSTNVLAAPYIFNIQPENFSTELATRSEVRGTESIELNKFFDQKSKKIDIQKIFAYSSSVGIKTSGLLIKFTALKALDELGEPFLRYPNGSWEDSLLDITLHPFGNRVRAKNSTILDECRSSIIALYKQQVRWGFDQVFVINDLIKLNLISSQLLILEPRNSEWYEYFASRVSYPYKGIIINPKQLIKLLSNILNITHYISEIVSEEIIKRELLPLQREFIDLIENIVIKEDKDSGLIRQDFPKYRPLLEAQEDFYNPRKGYEAATARILGNLLGLHALRKIYRESDIIFLGCRQN